MRIIPDLTKLPTWIGWTEPSTKDFSARIDLGSGQSLGAEDVVEGHFQRLSTDAQNVASLDKAIASLAPELTPLTDVAAEVADTILPAHPEAQFRANLHQALELAHKQQAAQRVLGIVPPQQAEQTWADAITAKPSLIACLFLFTSVLFIIWYRTRKIRQHE